MSELGDTFKALREKEQKKRRDKMLASMHLLRAQKIEFEMMSEYHLRIGHYDFWPSTGRWIDRRSIRKKGHGVLNLLDRLEKFP